MMIDKPYFTLRFDCRFCLGIYQLNGTLQDLGIPLEMQMQAPLKLEVPVNHWMREGRNELLAGLIPTEEDGFAPTTNCDLRLFVRQSGEDKDTAVELASIRFSGAAAAEGKGAEDNAPAARLDSKQAFAPQGKGDVVVEAVSAGVEDNGATVVRRGIVLPALGLPRWAYLDGDDITSASGMDLTSRVDDAELETLKQGLLPIYRTIWKALAAKKVSDVLPLFDERSRETDAAFHHEPGHTAKRLEDWLTEAATDPGMKQWPITEDNVDVEIHDHNKLVRLMQNNRRPLLSFDINGGGSRSFDIVFRKAGADWIIAR